MDEGGAALEAGGLLSEDPEEPESHEEYSGPELMGQFPGSSLSRAVLASAEAAAID